jgi:hypothetical protein
MGDSTVSVDRGLGLALRFLHTWRTGGMVNDELERHDLELAIAATEFARDRLALMGDHDRELTVEHRRFGSD